MKKISRATVSSLLSFWALAGAIPHCPLPLFQLPALGHHIVVTSGPLVWMPHRRKEAVNIRMGLLYRVGRWEFWETGGGSPIWFNISTKPGVDWNLDCQEVFQPPIYGNNLIIYYFNLLHYWTIFHHGHWWSRRHALHLYIESLHPATVHAFCVLSLFYTGSLSHQLSILIFIHMDINVWFYTVVFYYLLGVSASRHMVLVFYIYICIWL